MSITSTRLRHLFLLTADITMICAEAWVLTNSWHSSGVEMFRYYTQDSNLFALAVSLICALFAAYSLISGNNRPHFLKSLRLVAASGLMLTFLVAAFVLTPIDSGPSLKRYLVRFEQMMLDGPILYLHTLCPLFMFIAFIFLEDRHPLPRSHALLILPPTILYGAVTIYNNIIHTYSGPYPFLRVHRQPVPMTVLWCALILAGAWLISLSILEINRLIFRKHRSSINS